MKAAEIDDVVELVFAEGVEDDDVVDAVEELGAEVLAQVIHYAFFGFFEAVFAAGPGSCKLGSADVGGHDENRVLEVDGAALGIGKSSVINELQEDVEDVRVGLFDLVEEDDGVGPAAHRLGQLPTLIEADVARRRADQPRHSVLLHVLRHVDADHGRLVVEEEFGERTGGLRLADARGPEEDEAADGPLGVRETRAAATNRVGHGGKRLILADDPLAQTAFHLRQLLDLAFEHLRDRNAGPLGDDASDVLLVDLLLQQA